VAAIRTCPRQRLDARAHGRTGSLSGDRIEGGICIGRGSVRTTVIGRMTIQNYASLCNREGRRAAEEDQRPISDRWGRAGSTDRW